LQKVRPLLDDELLAVRTEAMRVLLRDVGELSEVDQLTLQPYLQAHLHTASLHADSAAGQSQLAEIYLALGDIPRAEVALQAGLMHNPQWVPAMINLADLWRATGRDQLGGELLAQALQTSPETPEVLLARSLWLVRQGQADAALPLLSKAASLAPLQPRYTYVYAIALHSSGSSQQALDVIDGFLGQREDQQLLQAAYSIAGDAGLAEQQQQYAQRLNIR
jgi:Tfp pilus assembly protein PilF